MRLVRDDRPTLGEAILPAGRWGLRLVRRELRGCGRAQALVGEGAEGLTLEMIGARPGLGENDRARRFAEFRLVIRRDDIVFLDRQLRERIARVAAPARTGLAADAADARRTKSKEAAAAPH